MLVFGHRGAAGHEPENTLRSIKKALELGVDGVEIDVRSVDGRLIVFHDDVLDRTTNGRGPIRQVSFETLRGLDAGCGENVPLLTEALELLDARVGLNIESKERGLASDIAATVAGCFEKQPAWRGRVMLSSFDREETAALAEIGGGCLLGMLFKEDNSLALERARRLGAYSLHAALKQLDPELVDAAHASGIKVFVYTVNETVDIERCRGLGVDGVFSDFPSGHSDRPRASFKFLTASTLRSQAMPHILAPDQGTTNSGRVASWRKAVHRAVVWREEARA